MFLSFEDRPSGSRLVERVWRCNSSGEGDFLSMAETNLEFVVSRVGGKTRMTLRGPVTSAKKIACPTDGHWVAIRLRPGTYLPGIPASGLLDHNDLDFAILDSGRFLFDGTDWEIPTYDNAEDFIARLYRNGLLAQDETVDAVVAGDRHRFHPRTIQRRFVRALGVAHSQFKQIGRARRAAGLLATGVSIHDAVHRSGYFDQAHLTRSLQRLIGQTPGGISRKEEQLSFSYKT